MTSLPEASQYKLAPQFKSHSHRASRREREKPTTHARHPTARAFPPQLPPAHTHTPGNHDAVTPLSCGPCALHGQTRCVESGRHARLAGAAAGACAGASGSYAPENAEGVAAGCGEGGSARLSDSGKWPPQSVALQPEDTMFRAMNLTLHGSTLEEPWYLVGTLWSIIGAYTAWVMYREKQEEQLFQEQEAARRARSTARTCSGACRVPSCPRPALRGY